MDQKDTVIEIDLGKLLHFYLQNWKALLCSIVGCALVALLITTCFLTPLYRSSVTVYVNNTTSTQGIEAVTGTNLNAAQQLVNTYVNIIKSNTVLDEVIKKGKLDCTAGEIREIMSANQVENTEMFRVTISHPDAEMAAHIANTIADVAPGRISEFVRGSSTEIIDYALVPQAPYTPNHAKNVVLGGLLGAVLVGGFLTLRFCFDMRIKTEDDISTYLKIPVLGSIPNHEPNEKKSSARNELTSSVKGGRA